MGSPWIRPFPFSPKFLRGFSRMDSPNIPAKFKFVALRVPEIIRGNDYSCCGALEIVGAITITITITQKLGMSLCDRGT